MASLKNPKHAILLSCITRERHPVNIEVTPKNLSNAAAVYAGDLKKECITYFATKSINSSVQLSGLLKVGGGLLRHSNKFNVKLNDQF